MRSLLSSGFSTDAEAEHDEDRGQHPESQRGEMEDGVGAGKVEPHQHVGEAEAHEGEQALLDMARGIGQRIAAVERVADLEEHQQPGQQHAERIAQAGGEIVALGLEDVAGGKEGERGHAVADQQPVEDGQGADVGAHDARVPGEAAEHDEARARRPRGAAAGCGRARRSRRW